MKFKLEKKELDYLFGMYQLNQNIILRNILVKLNTGLAIKCALKYKPLIKSTIDFEDVEQQAIEGLIYAIERYEINRKSSFGYFAYVTIEGKIKQYLRDKLNIVRIPQSVQKLYIDICRYRKNSNREPSTQELAKYFNVSPYRIEEALNAFTTVPFNSEEEEYLIGENNNNYSAYNQNDSKIEQLMLEGLRGAELWDKINEESKD